MTITRPHEGRHHITYPHRLGNPGVFEPLVVGSQEAAVFRRRRAFLGSLGPGQHSLSPTGTPFLEPAKNPDGRSYDCELIFVTTGPTRLGLDGAVGTLTDTAGHPAEFLMLGTATVTVSDPVRAVREGIGFGEPGEAFDAIVIRRLLAGIGKQLAAALERGIASASDLPGLGRSVVQLGYADHLGAAPLGVEIQTVEISRLHSRQGLPPAGRDAGQKRAQAAEDASLPKHRSCRWGATRIPFFDSVYQMQAHVSAVGYFEGDPVPPHLEQWMEDVIVTAIRHAATTWKGTVLDLAAHKDGWARYVTQSVMPQVNQHVPLRGRIVVEAVEISPQEHVELKRRRAAQLVRGQ